MAPQDATTNSSSLRTSITATPMSVPNADPIGNLANSQRITQQQVQAAAVQQRLFRYQIFNSPDLTAEPKSVVLTLVAGAAWDILWSINSTLDNTSVNNQLFTLVLGSIYVNPTPGLTRIGEFDLVNDHWPVRGVYDMFSFPVSMHYDEGDTNGVDLKFDQAVWNHSGADVSVCFTIRTRSLLNYGNGAVAF